MGCTYKLVFHEKKRKILETPSNTDHFRSIFLAKVFK